MRESRRIVTSKHLGGGRLNNSCTSSACGGRGVWGDVGPRAEVAEVPSRTSRIITFKHLGGGKTEKLSHWLSWWRERRNIINLSLV